MWLEPWGLGLEPWGLALEPWGLGINAKLLSSKSMSQDGVVFGPIQ